jgi:hypothetical protein
MSGVSQIFAAGREVESYVARVEEENAVLKAENAAVKAENAELKTALITLPFAQRRVVRRMACKAAIKIQAQCRRYLIQCTFAKIKAAIKIPKIHKFTRRYLIHCTQAKAAMELRESALNIEGVTEFSSWLEEPRAINCEIGLTAVGPPRTIEATISLGSPYTVRAENRSIAYGKTKVTCVTAHEAAGWSGGGWYVMKMADGSIYHLGGGYGWRRGDEKKHLPERFKLTEGKSGKSLGKLVWRKGSGKKWIKWQDENPEFMRKLYRMLDSVRE